MESIQSYNLCTHVLGKDIYPYFKLLGLKLHTAESILVPFLMKYIMNIFVCFIKIANRSIVHFGLSKIDYIVSFCSKRTHWPLFGLDTNLY